MEYGEKEEINIFSLVKQMKNCQDIQNLWFAVRSVDNVGNVSENSNIVRLSMSFMPVFEDKAPPKEDNIEKRSF